MGDGGRLEGGWGRGISLHEITTGSIVITPSSAYRNPHQDGFLPASHFVQGTHMTDLIFRGGSSVGTREHLMSLIPGSYPLIDFYRASDLTLPQLLSYRISKIFTRKRFFQKFLNNNSSSASSTEDVLFFTRCFCEIGRAHV